MRGHFKQLTENDYFELPGAAAFVHNGTPLATIEQDLGCQATARGRAEAGDLNVTETVAAIVSAHRAGTLSPAQTVARSYLRIRNYNDPAVFISLQWWWADQGGVYILWYLPLLLLLMFRPNLQDRVAIPIAPETDWLTRSLRWCLRTARRIIRLSEPAEKNAV